MAVDDFCHDLAHQCRIIDSNTLILLIVNPYLAHTPSDHEREAALKVAKVFRVTRKQQSSGLRSGTKRRKISCWVF